MEGGVNSLISDYGEVLMEQRRNKIPNQLKMRREVSMPFRETDDEVEARCWDVRCS